MESPTYYNTKELMIPLTELATEAGTQHKATDIEGELREMGSRFIALATKGCKYGILPDLWDVVEIKRKQCLVKKEIDPIITQDDMKNAPKTNQDLEEFEENIEENLTHVYLVSLYSTPNGKQTRSSIDPFL
uniref:Uncharacterized protein n=1 Tax=Lactuca sativa TaxID=4236 RepID=A0A9R1US01_LACSA|nr:hypothetical protein LSAT_V11C800403520 [Lactuca sativa]